MGCPFCPTLADRQVEKKEKPEEADAAGDDDASERDLSRREQKAPARDREQPTTGEDTSSPSGAGEGPDAIPSLGEVAHAPAPVTGDGPGPAPEPETPASEGGKSGLFSRFTEGKK